MSFFSFFTDVANAFTSVGNSIKDGIVATVNEVAGGTEEAAKTVATGITTTAYTISDGVVGAANAVNDDVINAWKKTSDTANKVANVCESTGLIIGNATIIGANSAAKYSEEGVKYVGAALVETGRYIEKEFCIIGIGSLLGATFAGLAADGEEEATFGPISLLAETTSEAEKDVAIHAVAVLLAEPIYLIPGISDVCALDTLTNIIASIISQALTDYPKEMAASAGLFLAALIIPILSTFICEGTLPAEFTKSDLSTNKSVSKFDSSKLVRWPRNYFQTGDFLTTNQYVSSENGQYHLIVQEDGNLCIYKCDDPVKKYPTPSQCIWNSNNLRRRPSYLIMQPDGNLVQYPGTGPGDKHGDAIWSIQQVREGKLFFALLQNDGNLSVSYGLNPNLDGGLFWSAPYITKVLSHINTGGYLPIGGYITSPNRNCYLVLQTDGNLVLYKGSGPVNGPQEFIWQSLSIKGVNQGPYYLRMQSDGNLCIYKGDTTDPKACIWASRTNGATEPSFLMVRDDLNVVIYKGTGPTNIKGYVWSAMPLNSSDVTIYSDVRYGGKSQKLTVGKYDMNSLTIGNDALSSFHVPPGLQVTLYTDANFKGDALRFFSDVPVIDSKYNDTISSIEVSELNSRVVIYQSGCFTGSCIDFAPGQYDVDKLGIGNDKLSSIKVPKGLKVTIYEHAQFKGNSISYTSDVEYVGKDFDDICSSLIVEKV